MVVSVIIPCFNHVRFIREAVESVRRQTAYDSVCDIVAFDDASIDGSAAILDELQVSTPKLRVIRTGTNRGVSAARNTAVAASRGELLAFLDGDDIWAECKLALQLVAYQRRPEVGLVYSDFFEFSSDSGDAALVRVRRLDAHPPYLLGQYFVEDGPVIPSTILMPRGIFETLGGFDEALSVAEDNDLCLRVAARHPFEHIAQPLVFKRRHDMNLSRRLVTWVGAFEQITARYVGRFPDLERYAARRLARRYAKVGHDSAAKGWTLEGLRYLAKAMRYDPWFARPYVYLLLALLPTTMRGPLTVLLKRWYHGEAGSGRRRVTAGTR
jgi:glycosyltransferase involved in cell wall biosynthesis